MQQEVVLAMLAKEPSYGYQLRTRLRDAQRAAMAEPDHADAALLLEGVVLRLQADLRWLEACEQSWTVRRSGS